LLEFKRLRENHQQIEPLFIEYKRDNETLRRIEDENERLREIFVHHSVGEGSGKARCSDAKEVNA
jgi:hypothetical protein